MATITCPSCQSTYEIDTRLLSQNLDSKGERHLRCTECKTQFSYKPVVIPAELELTARSLDSSKDTDSHGDGLDLVARPEKRFGIPSTAESLDEAPEAVEWKPGHSSAGALSATTLRRDPVAGAHKPPKRMVGFQNEPKQGDTAPDDNSPKTPTNDRKSVLGETVRTSNTGTTSASNGFLTSLIAILTFLAFTALTVWWVWINKPEWLLASNWTNSNAQERTAPVTLASAAAESDAIQQEIIEDEIMSLPLVRPEIKGQKVETKTAGDQVELYLAGVLQNQSDQAVRLERLRAIALDDDGKVAKSWTFSPGARTLAKTEVLPFSNRTTWPQGEKLIVKFGWESAIAKLPEAVAYDILVEPAE